MYWLMSGDSSSLVPLALTWGASAVGGWLLARSAFRLERRERLSVGLAVGLVAYLFAANILGQWLKPSTAFSASGAVVLAAGLIAWRRTSRPDLREDRGGWPLILGFVLAAGFFTLTGRGLAILDDRKNLSLISLMAAGDIPPHFYMNPSSLFRYHYAFQLLGASAVRLGALFPWSAFDLTKGIVASLSLVVGYLAGIRLTHRSLGGWLTAGSMLFAGGARWLLLVAPPSFLTAVSPHVELWGSAGGAGETLRQALMGSWIVGGGPPQPIPFAFLSGVLEPFVLGMQAGPGSLSRLILLLVPLLMPRSRGAGGAAVLAVLMACWGLAFDAVFGLFGLGIVAVAAAARVWRNGPPWLGPFRWTVVAVMAGGLISLIQGGTLTEMLRSFLAGGETGVAGGVPLITLRWPPAIVSSHLGALSLFRPATLIVALAELGAALVGGVLVLGRARHWGRQGRFDRAGLAAASVIGFVVPMFVGYWPDRDITRLSAFSLVVWILLAVPVVLQVRRAVPAPAVTAAAVCGFALLNLSGLVVLGSLMTALPAVVLTEKMAPLDAGMATRMWDALPPDAVVFDSHPWRAVVLTGRPARSSEIDYSPRPAWEALVANPTPRSMASAGYTYAYIDEHWWRGLPEAARSSFDDSCVRTLWEGEDNADNGFRRLIDITSCAGEGG